MVSLMLGPLDPPTLELERGLSKEVVSLVSAYLAGQTGTMEFATTMEKVRLQRSTQQNPAMETSFITTISTLQTYLSELVDEERMWIAND